MKILNLNLFFLLLITPAHAQTYQWSIDHVVDGDTVKVNLPSIPPKLNPISVRILGIDTPEKGDLAKCKKERELAEKATAFSQQAFSHGKNIQFINVKGWDKYHRILAEVIIDGKNLGNLLIQNGLARKYNGAKRAGWCD